MSTKTIPIFCGRKAGDQSAHTDTLTSAAGVKPATKSSPHHKQEHRPMKKLLRPLRHRVICALLLPLFVSSVSMEALADDSHVALEVVAVKLSQIRDMEAFRKNDKLIAQWVANQPGFISRETAMTPDGEWFVIVHWASLKEAEAAGGVFMTSEQGQKAMSMIDQESMFFKHYIKTE